MCQQILRIQFLFKHKSDFSRIAQRFPNRLWPIFSGAKNPWLCIKIILRGQWNYVLCLIQFSNGTQFGNLWSRKAKKCYLLRYNFFVCKTYVWLLTCSGAVNTELAWVMVTRWKSVVFKLADETFLAQFSPLLDIFSV